MNNYTKTLIYILLENNYIINLIATIIANQN